MRLAIVVHPLIDIKELSKSIAYRFGLKYIDLDEKELVKNKGIFEDSSLDGVLNSIVFAQNCNNCISVYLKYSRDYLLNKIAKEKHLELKDAVDYLEKIEFEKKDFYIKFYGINIFDYSKYDLVIACDNLDNEGIISVIEKYINKLKK